MGGNAKSFRELTGAQPSTASPSDSTLVIIDAQNECAPHMLNQVPQCIPDTSLDMPMEI